MENPVSLRIAQIIRAEKLSNNAFAKSIGKTSSTINQIVAGRNKPGFEILDAICDAYPNLNPTWLLRGEGEMWKGKAQEQVKDENYLQEYLSKLEDQFKRVLSQLEKKDHQLESKDHQIQNLQEMLKMQLGKHKGVIFLTSRNIFLEAAEIAAVRA